MHWPLTFSKMLLMKLDDYLKITKIKPVDAAKELGISRFHFWCVRKGKSPGSKKLQIKIVEWSNGVVTFDKLNGKRK